VALCNQTEMTFTHMKRTATRTDAATMKEGPRPVFVIILAGSTLAFASGGWPLMHALSCLRRRCACTLVPVCVWVGVFVDVPWYMEPLPHKGLG